MRYNLVNILKKIAFTFAITIFSFGLSYAQSTISLLDEDFGDDFGVNVEEKASDEFSSGADNSLVFPVKAVSSQKSSVSTDIDDSFDGFADLEINQAEIDEINNSIGRQPQKVTPQPVRTISSHRLGEDIIESIDEDLFSQMTSIEKQTSLLTLELRRERIKTEIEAIRIARAKALAEEDNARELKIRERQEWEMKKEKDLLVEQDRLAKTRIAEEQLRQEKIVLAYKAQMLKEAEEWIQALEVAYIKVKAVEKDRDENLSSFKTRITDLASRASDLSDKAKNMKANYTKATTEFQAQIIALETRVASLNTEKIDGVDNPFARPGFGSTDNPNIKLSEEYIVLEITGKGDILQAKISNKTGDQAFLVQRGTELKTGHIIEEIAPTFIRADRGGIKDFIYFTAGGILDKEPDSDLKIKNIPTNEASWENLNTGSTANSFLNGMFVN